mgnify:CR=1 FL=1
MALQALYTAATGMKAMDFKLNVTANNLANIETTAFKRSRVNFEDLIYRTLEQPGLRNGLENHQDVSLVHHRAGTACVRAQALAETIGDGPGDRKQLRHGRNGAT